MQKTDLSELDETSATFFELFKFLQTILAYCDILKEIKPKREHIRCLENELEKSINVLQVLSIEKNQLEIDLVELNEKHLVKIIERDHAEKNLLDTEKCLVSLSLFFGFFCVFFFLICTAIPLSALSYPVLWHSHLIRMKIEMVTLFHATYFLLFFFHFFVLFILLNRIFSFVLIQQNREKIKN